MGMRFAETPSGMAADQPGMCMFSVDPEASAALGDAAGEAMDSVLESGVAGAATSGAEAFMGAVQTGWPSVLVTGLLSLIIGFAFMILLRWFVGIIIWASIASVFVLLFTG